MENSKIGGGPYFEDLSVGDVIESSPRITLTQGHAALHQSIIGSRLALALDRELSIAVTGERSAFVNPALVCDIAVGQSSLATQRGRANLYYAGLYFTRFARIGDTLRTRTEVVGLKRNRSKPTGVVALRMTTLDQEDRVVLECWRCGMLPIHDEARATNHADDLTQVGEPLDLGKLSSATSEWDIDVFRKRVQRGSVVELTTGDAWDVEYGDVVTSAPELARLTCNVAAAHHDELSTSSGQRLVYGGHTIGLALAQLTRALPQIVTIAGWHRCDHVGPVHEGDTLFSTIRVDRVDALAKGGSLAHLHSTVSSVPKGERDAAVVLEWHLVAVVP